MIRDGVIDRRSQNEKTKAFSAIIENNKDLINRICFCYANTNEDYDDLRQDAIINIWKGLDTFREEAKSSTWIYRVCLNTCVTSWRRNSWKTKTQSIEFSRLPEKSETDPATEDMEYLHFLISRLTSSEKALIMMWLDEMSYEDISSVTGLNRNTIATKLRRIKEKLAKMAQTIK